MRNDVQRAGDVLRVAFWFSMMFAIIVAVGATVQHKLYQREAIERIIKIEELQKQLTTFETLLVNEKGDTVKATFTVKNDNVIYFIVSDKWKMQTPRKN